MVNSPPLPPFLLQRDGHSYTDTSKYICWATDTQTHKATYLEEPQTAKIQNSYKKFVFIELMCSFALWLVKQTVFIISNQLSVPVLLFNITGMQSKYWPDWYEGTLMGCHFFQVPTTRHCLADRLFIVLCPVNCWWCYGAVLPVTHTYNENVNAKDFQILWKSWAQMRKPFPLMSAQG